MALHATSSAPPQVETMTSAISPVTTSAPNMHTPLRRTPSIAPQGNNKSTTTTTTTTLPHHHRHNPLHLGIQNPEKMVSDWLQMHPSVQTSAPGGVGGKDRHSPSLAEHAPLSPQSSVTSSGSGGSDAHQDTHDGPQPIKDSFMEDGSGMREVPVWLKTLRLHKYAYLFRQMTYEEMLNISEEWLESQKVTKGARHKIVISIKKLRERQPQLREFEKRIMEGGPIKGVLGEMKHMLNTPMKATPPPSQLCGPPSPCSTDTDIPEGNLPGQFIRLMGKVCTQLLTTSVADDESLQIFFQLIDKCAQHEAFSLKQRSLVQTWKLQAQKIWQPSPHRHGGRQKGWGNTFPFHSTAGRTSSCRGRPAPPPISNPQWSFGSRRSLIGSPSVHHPLQRNSSLNTAMLNKPGLMEATKQPVTRTQSAPLRSSQLSLTQSLQGPGSEAATDTEINARLDSLCLSMTEHALGGDSNDKGSTF